MIITFDQLYRLQNNDIAMVDGGFDPLHLGHIEYFRSASSLGSPLLCCLASDRYVSTKHKPLLPQHYRAGVLDAIRYIDYVIINELSSAEVLTVLRPKFYIKGMDWEGRLPPDEISVCEKNKIEVIYLNTVLDSSSRILEEYWSSQS